MSMWQTHNEIYSLPIVYKLGITNPTPLKNNLVLEIYKKRVYTHIVSTHMHKQNLSMMHIFISKTFGQIDRIIIPKIIIKLTTS